MAPNDADFDHMHHALGRPDGPHVEPYRNYFAVDPKSRTARRFMRLGLWTRGRAMPGGLACFHVTPEGQRLTMAWLAARQRKAGLRPWIVYGPEVSTRTIIAKSAPAAVYHVFLDLNDAWNIGFRDFLRLGVRARAA